MFSKYLEELQKVKLLSHDEELSLWQAAGEGDTEARNLLLRSYQPLVFKTALAFGRREEELMELVQEGTVGLLEAAERFDYTRGVAFSVYAVHRIRGRMVDFLKEEGLGESLPLGEMGLVAELASPYEETYRHLLQDRVQEAMVRLPAREQQVLEAMYLEDRSAGEVASDINVSTSYVYRLEKQGIRRIRGMLSRFMAELKEN